MGISVRVVCLNYLLRHFIAMYNYETDKVLKNEYLVYYDSLLSMIPQDCDKLVSSPFYISVDYYGADNKSPTYYKQLSYVKRDLGEISQLDYPANYMPDKNAKSRKPRPTIDVSIIKEFNKDGSIIPPEDDSLSNNQEVNNQEANYQKPDLAPIKKDGRYETGQKIVFMNMML